MVKRVNKMSRYNHQEIEAKWVEIWEKTKIYEADEKSKKPKLYHLVMYPYPSGDLHTGHWYNFSGADFRARLKRMQGYNVLNPIGFDSFGLPAENAAIKRGLNPKDWTYSNINNMVKQLKSSGISFDWSRMLATSDPEYYKWTQWMFLYMYNRGLAYKKKVVANWCPSCNTVLANEQVVAEGVCERCETKVEQKELEQWLFKITDYADRLLSGLEDIDWPERTKTMQRNWIGKSEGAEIKFAVKGSKEEIKVFTTRPDTIFGATFMVLAPENPIVTKITTASQKAEVEKYVEKTAGKTELQRMEEGKNKTGVFTGTYAVNPANGKEIPVWISDYVLMSYGRGAIMAVPAHDERDADFANKYELPFLTVVSPEEGKMVGVAVLIHVGDGKYLFHKRDHNTDRCPGKIAPFGGGLADDENTLECAVRELKEELGLNIEPSKLKSIGVFKHLKNQEELSQIFLLDLPNKSNLVVDEGESMDTLTLNEVLESPNTTEYLKMVVRDFSGGQSDSPENTAGYTVNSGEFDGLETAKAKEKIVTWLEEKGAAKKTINYKLRDWLISRQRYWGAPIPIIYCPKCGEVPVPEKDLPVLLPDEAEFKPTGESPLKLDPNFVNVKCPKCGGAAKRETDTMDTFVCSSWYFFRYADPKNPKEFAAEGQIKKWLPVDMYVGGAEHSVLHLLYSRFFTKALFDGGHCDFEEPFMALRHQGMILGPNGLKMSKSKGNVVDPDEIVREHGADAVRTYMGFMGPYDQGGPWNPKGLSGVRRFLDKVWTLFEGETTKDEPDLAETKLLNRTIKKVGEDIDNFRFNTAISSLMILVNELGKNKVQHERSLGLLTLMLAPFAPFVTEELWAKLGNTESVHLALWPTFDEKYLEDEICTIVIQINGKVRANIEMSKGSTQETVEKEALADTNVKKFLGGHEFKKAIYIQDKLLNLVIQA